MEILAPKLLVYGPLGIMCLVLMYAVIHLYQAKERQAREYQERLDVLADRARINAESWAEKGFLLGERLVRGVERAKRKRGEEDRGDE